MWLLNLRLLPESKREEEKLENCSYTYLQACLNANKHDNLTIHSSYYKWLLITCVVIVTMTHRKNLHKALRSTVQ